MSFRHIYYLKNNIDSKNDTHINADQKQLSHLIKYNMLIKPTLLKMLRFEKFSQYNTTGKKKDTEYI